MEGRSLAGQTSDIEVNTGIATLTAGAAAVLAATGVYPRAAEVRVKTKPMHWYADGSKPNGMTGIYAAVAEIIELDTPAEITNFQATSCTGDTGYIDASFYV